VFTGTHSENNISHHAVKMVLSMAFLFPDQLALSWIVVATTYFVVCNLARACDIIFLDHPILSLPLHFNFYSYTSHSRKC